MPDFPVDGHIYFQVILFDKQLKATTPVALVTSGSSFNIICSYESFKESFHSNEETSPLSFPTSVTSATASVAGSEASNGMKLLIFI